MSLLGPELSRQQRQEGALAGSPVPVTLPLPFQMEPGCRTGDTLTSVMVDLCVTFTRPPAPSYLVRHDSGCVLRVFLDEATFESVRSWVSSVPTADRGTRRPPEAHEHLFLHIHTSYQFCYSGEPFPTHLFPRSHLLGDSELRSTSRVCCDPAGLGQEAAGGANSTCRLD